jgi:hypothetical protein
VLRICLLSLVLSAGFDAAPRSNASIAAVAVPTATAIKLDGEFSESVWETVPAVGGFRQREPKDGETATYPTEVKVVYDAAHLYVAVFAHDPEPSRIIGMRTRRDSQSPSDWIRVFVDSFYDRRSAFEFGVNPAGVKRDVAWSNDTSEDPGWDAVWDVSVSQSSDGWRAEFRIPFSQLRFRRSDNATFGFAVARQIGRLNETDTWPLLSKSASGVVSSFGDLTGLQLTQTPKRLELVPYVVGQLNTQPREAGNPLVSAREPKGTIGADLKYAVRPGLTLTATVNPDFGQVEADPAVVNLSGFETFFSERRPFFVEGSGMFTFDLDCSDGSCSGLFYPRRIGRSPRGFPSLEEGQYARVPQQSSILGAAKLTGRFGRFSFGALNAVTADEEATIAHGALRRTESVEPLTNFTVLRSRREFANQSTVGFMVTATTRRLSTFTDFLPDQAFTGFVHGVGTQHREQEVPDERLAQVDDVDAGGARLQRLVTDRDQLLALPEIRAVGHHLAPVRLDEPAEDDRGVEPARVREHHARDVRHRRHSLRGGRGSPPSARAGGSPPGRARWSSARPAPRR